MAGATTLKGKDRAAWITLYLARWHGIAIDVSLGIFSRRQNGLGTSHEDFFPVVEETDVFLTNTSTLAGWNPYLQQMSVPLREEVIPVSISQLPFLSICMSSELKDAYLLYGTISIDTCCGLFRW